MIDFEYLKEKIKENLDYMKNGVIVKIANRKYDTWRLKEEIENGIVGESIDSAIKEMMEDVESIGLLNLLDINIDWLDTNVVDELIDINIKVKSFDSFIVSNRLCNGIKRLHKAGKIVPLSMNENVHDYKCKLYMYLWILMAWREYSALDKLTWLDV